jgi:hypothetical protein
MAFTSGDIGRHVPIERTKYDDEQKAAIAATLEGLEYLSYRDYDRRCFFYINTLHTCESQRPPGRCCSMRPPYVACM